MSASHKLMLSERGESSFKKMPLSTVEMTLLGEA